jgi:nitric oxide reductase
VPAQLTKGLAIANEHTPPYRPTHNQVILAGEGVILSNQSANRDEAVFEDADKFDIHRAPGFQIGLGYGTHVCVAEWLARAELETVFGAPLVFVLDFRCTVN